MADTVLAQLLEGLRRQRQDIDQQMEDTDASQTRTSDLMKSIEALHERVQRTTSVEAPKKSGE